MVAFYIRLSRLDDDLDEHKRQSNSVTNQRRLLQDYFAEIPDLRSEDIEEFIDDGWSGMDFQRPAFQRMLALIKKRTVTTVLVKDFSRFGRNYVECADYLEKLFPFLGTRFISVLDRYDSGRAAQARQMQAGSVAQGGTECRKCPLRAEVPLEGREAQLRKYPLRVEVAAKNIVNSYYSQDLSRKITSTFDVKRENGEFFFNAPFGYRKDPERRGKVRIDPEAAEIVRYIFALACAGRRPGEIAKRLNQENVPTKAAYNQAHRITGKSTSLETSVYAAWTGAKVSSVLKNEVYMGIYVAQRSRRAAVGAKKAVMVADTRRIPNNHPAIVSKAEFEKAQAIFTQTKRKKPEDRPYPLRSRVFCGTCGYAMAYRETLYEACYFYCAHTIQTGNRVGCPTECFSEDLLNARVFAQLKQWMLTLEAACGSAEAAEQKRREGLRLLMEDAESLRADLIKRQETKISLYERYREGNLEKNTYLVQKHKLTAEQNSIRVELDRVHQREARLRALRNRRKPELDDLMEQAALFQGEAKLTCVMAQAFVERVTIYDKWHIDITWKGEALVDAALAENSGIKG
ncbi:MAG: recombinase family protein [Clostridiales bacterium]|nr:recombinase family protein [Clostridiales bacterium]